MFQIQGEEPVLEEGVEEPEEAQEEAEAEEEEIPSG